MPIVGIKYLKQKYSSTMNHPFFWTERSVAIVIIGLTFLHNFKLTVRLINRCEQSFFVIFNLAKYLVQTIKIQMRSTHPKCFPRRTVTLRFYHSRMQTRNNFTQVCLCVCLSICVSVQAVTFELL